MMNYKSVEGSEKSGWTSVKATPSQFVAAEVTRRSGRSRANCVRRCTLWMTDQASVVIQNPPPHVGGYRAMCAGRAVNCDAPNRESSISKSLICRIALRKSLIFTIFLDFSHGSRGVQWRFCSSSPKFRISLCKSLIFPLFLDISRAFLGTPGETQEGERQSRWGEMSSRNSISGRLRLFLLSGFDRVSPYREGCSI
jgi:hypothetical protein